MCCFKVNSKVNSNIVMYKQSTFQYVQMYQFDLCIDSRRTIVPGLDIEVQVPSR